MITSDLLRSLLPLGALALVAGCSWFGGGDEKDKVTCPGALIAPGLDAYTVFRPGGGNSAADIQFGVKLVSVKATCKPEKGGLLVDTVLTFRAARNGEEVNQGDFSYFVAVADAQQNILSKQTFTLRVQFDRRQKDLRLVDDIIERLPLRNLANGNNYGVVVGMQLSQEQLDLTRQRPEQ